MTDLATSSDLNPALQGDDAEGNVPPSRIRRALRWIGWTWFALFVLVVFTLLKLPEERIRGFIQGSIAAALAQQGIGFTAEQGFISMFRAAYILKTVTLTFPSGDAVKVEKVAFSPALLPLLSGRQGGTLQIENEGGTLSASFSMKNGSFQLSYDASGIDIGKIGLLPAVAGVKGGAVLTGQGQLAGELDVPSTWTGQVQLQLGKIVVDQQSVMSFPIPRMTISEAKADLTADKGKAVIRTLQLGRPGNAADDLRATVTGDASLSRSIPSSTLNLRVQLGVSENVLKSLSLLEMVLAQGKQPDGTYAFTLNGPVSSPLLSPVPAGAGR